MQVVYSWTHAVDRAGARALVQAMHEAALKLPFKEVGPILEDEWGETQVNDPETRGDPSRPRLTEADFERHLRRWPGRWFVQNLGDIDAHMTLIEPTWSCYFIAQLNGCDPVTAGLASHIDKVKVQREFSIDEVRTNLGGKMAWQCKCETLNAMLPQIGGWDNFFKQHTTVLKFLEKIEKLGLELDVWDQGKFWETTNPDLLRDELRRSAAITAHTVGYMKDRLREHPELADEIPLLKHPEFERLEAEGERIMAEGPSPAVRRILDELEEGEEWKHGGGQEE